MNILEESRVKYACSCGILNPINRLLFCRHCPKLRCGFCVCHEVESNFCSNCLENIPSSEARHKKNCCANCFDCPCCQHTLSARATTVPILRKSDTASSKDGEGDTAANTSMKPASKKMYYLSCLACRWTSRDVGIPDQNVASGTWPENECSYQMRFNTLLEYFQAVVLQEKQEKQEYLRRKAQKAYKFPSLTDRTGLTVSMIRRQIGWTEKSHTKPKVIDIDAAVADEDVDQLPDDVFTQKVNIRNVTTIAQRHSQVAEQPNTVNKLYPQRRPLWIKRSLRCRECEHNLIKPEYHPTSIKYRIQLFASYHIPEVVLVKLEQPLHAGKQCAVLLKFTNPTMFDTTITLLELQNVEELTDDLTALSIAPTSAMPAPKVTAIRQMSTIKRQRSIHNISNADIEIPVESFVLQQRDDSKEFDEDIQVHREEPKFIIWRKSNKVLLKLAFTPNETLKIDDTVTIGFTMQNSYVNTVANTAEKKDPITYTLNSNLFINVGAIAAE